MVAASVDSRNSLNSCGCPATNAALDGCYADSVVAYDGFDIDFDSSLEFVVIAHGLHCGSFD